MEKLLLTSIVALALQLTAVSGRTQEDSSDQDDLIGIAHMQSARTNGAMVRHLQRQGHDLEAIYFMLRGPGLRKYQLAWELEQTKASAFPDLMNPQIQNSSLASDERAILKKAATPDWLTLLDRHRPIMVPERPKGEEEPLPLPPVPEEGVSKGIIIVPNVFTVGDSCDFATIQQAVNAAGSGAIIRDVIRVQGKTFTGTAASFDVAGKSVRIVGGYNSTCTLLRGGRSTIDGSGQSVADSMIEISGAGASVLIENFNVTSGGDDGEGGGIEIDDASLTLKNADVYANHSAIGGGIHMHGIGSLVLDGVRVYANTALGNGGGIYCDNATVNLIGGTQIGILEAGIPMGNVADSDANGQGNGGGILVASDCTLNVGAEVASAFIRYNSANNGGGIAAFSAAVNILGADTRVDSNVASAAFGTGSGGGLFLSSTTATVTSADITANQARRGGGIYITTSNGGAAASLGLSNFTSCTQSRCLEISNNQAIQSGGGLYATGGATVTGNTSYLADNTSGTAASMRLLQGASLDLTDSMIIGNLSSNGQPVVLDNTSFGSMDNVTVAGNNSTDALIQVGENVNFDAFGLVVWDNAAASLFSSIPASSNVSIAFSVVQYSGLGASNLIQDPLFLDPNNGNYHISALSPAVDFLPSGNLYDIDLETRPVAGGAYDAGADEAYARIGIAGLPCSFDKIASAVSAATSGQTIFISAGNYPERIGEIDRSLSLLAATPDCTQADLSANATSVVVDASAINGISEGGVARVSGPVTVNFENMTIKNGHALVGGGMWIDASSTVFLTNVNLFGNQADFFGGGIANGGLLDIGGDSRFSLNSAGTVGGGLSNTGGIVHLRDDTRIGNFTIFSFGNTALEAGGGVATYSGGLLELHDNAQIRNNQATANLATGGGIHASSGSQVVLNDFSGVGVNNANSANSSAGHGGGLFLTGLGTQLIVNDSATISFNQSDGRGGGFYLDAGAQANMNGGQVSNNQAGDLFIGGGIYAANDTGTTVPVHIANAIIGNNTAGTGAGLGMGGNDFELEVVNSQISDNTAVSSAGGMWLVGDNLVTLRDGTEVSGNSSPSNAGGIMIQTGVNLELIATTANVVIGGNTALLQGGGIYAFNGAAPLNLFASAGHAIRFSNNSAGGNGGGAILAGVDLQAQGQVEFIGNDAAFGGGLYLLSAAGSLQAGMGSGLPLFADNHAGSGGGAVVQGQLASGDSVLFSGVRFVNNQATGQIGGGLLLDGADVVLENAWVHGNSAAAVGGGISSTNSELEVRSNEALTVSCDALALGINQYCSEVRGNAAGNLGSGLYLAGTGSADLAQVALVDNLGTQAGAILVAGSSTADLSLRNALVSGHGDSALQIVGAGSVIVDASTFANNRLSPMALSGGPFPVTVTNTIVSGNLGGVSSNQPISGACNIDQAGVLPGISLDPLFVATGRGDYRLDPNSPAVDACATGPAEGLDFNLRPQDGDGQVSSFEYDMGAFERRPARLLTVVVQGPGSVTSTPVGIDCGSSCSYNFDLDSQVNLTAVPQSSMFVNWSGDCTGTVCVLSMSAARTVTATFVPGPELVFADSFE